MSSGPILSEPLYSEVVEANRRAVQRNLELSVEDAKLEILHRWAAVEAIQREAERLFGSTSGALAMNSFARRLFHDECDEIIAGVSWEPPR